MNYKNKYIKYKTKYLIEKIKQYGGENQIKLFDDILDLDTEEKINIIKDKKLLFIPMNAYEISNLESDNILITGGVTDCVVITVFNNKYGSYLGHFYRFNEFFEEKSDGCELMDEEDKEKYCTNPIKNKYKCDDESTKIINTLPEWIDDKDTEISIISQADNFPILARYIQFIKKYKNPKINIHLITPKSYIKDDDDDIETQKFFIENNKINCIKELDIIKKILQPSEDFITKWNYQNSDFYQYFGINKNGDIFKIKHNNLPNIIKEKFRATGSIKTTHINQRCVIKMSNEL